MARRTARTIPDRTDTDCAGRAKSTRRYGSRHECTAWAVVTVRRPSGYPQPPNLSTEHRIAPDRATFAGHRRCMTEPTARSVRRPVPRALRPPWPPALLALATVLAVPALLVLASVLPVGAMAAPTRPGHLDRPAAPWRWPLPSGSPGSGPSESSESSGADAPKVTRYFDPPDTPYGPGHRGVDLAATPGTPVLAAGPGVVGYVGVLAGRGVVTVLHAGGLRTTYEPVHPLVRPGQHVLAGSRLGTVLAGHAGCPAPACLHWGLLRADTYLDPLSLLARGPVRLLPEGSPPPRPVEPGPHPPPHSGAASPGPASGPNPAGLGMVAAGMVTVGALGLSRSNRPGDRHRPP